MPVEVHRLPKFEILYNLPEDTHTIILIGGRGGSKTYEISKFIAYQASIKKKRCVILRDEKSIIKESILNEIWARYNTANEFGALDTECIKNETELKDRKTGDTLLYTKGFRASANDKKANLKGPSDIDIAVIEEAEDIRDPTKYNTFVDGLRKEGCLRIILLNTPDIGHWIVKRFFTLKAVLNEFDEPLGFFELQPKSAEIIKGVVIIQTSYQDNPYLTANTISEYEGYGNPSHYLYDPFHYYTAIRGYASTGRKGQIFTKVKPITRAEYNAMQYRTVYGQDFGTASPAALAGVKFNKNNVYMDCLNYKPAEAIELAKMYCLLRLNHNTDKIVCDYAEPDTITLLENGFKQQPVEDYQKYQGLAQGWYVVPCPSKDIEAGISLMKSLNLYLVEDCTEAWEEVNNYVYAQDKYKNYTNTPIDDFNHFLDAARYVISEERGNKGIVFS